MRTTALLVVLLVVLAGCVGEGTPTSSTALPTSPPSTQPPATSAPTTSAPSTVPSTTTTVTTTTSTTSTSTTTVPTGGPYDIATLGYFPPSFPGSDGAAGSGCAPGTDLLPDGAWFGDVVARTATGIEFDLACFWTGERANEVSEERGWEVPVPNDYVITNDNPRLRTIAIGADVPVIIVGDVTDWPPDPVPFSDWPVPVGEDPLGCHLGGEYSFCIVWLYINDGAVTEVIEQYVP